MIDQQVMTEVLGSIMQMTDTACLQTISETARNRLEGLLELKVANINIGDKVQLLPRYQGRKPYGAIGTVTKVNPRRFKVNFGSLRYTVPKAMVARVGQS